MSSPPPRPSLARQFIHLVTQSDCQESEVLSAKVSWFGHKLYAKYLYEPYGFYIFADGSTTFLFPNGVNPDDHDSSRNS